MPHTIVILRLLTGALFGLILIGLMPVPVNAARGGGKTEVMPVQKAAPAVVVIDATGSEHDLRKQLRGKNNVAEPESTR